MSARFRICASLYVVTRLLYAPTVISPFSMWVRSTELSMPSCSGYYEFKLLQFSVGYKQEPEEEQSGFLMVLP